MDTTPDPSMPDDRSFWIATADSRAARILYVTFPGHERLHVDAVASLDEDWDEHQHGRPSPRASGNRHSGASEGHEGEERLQRFARSVSEWMETEFESHGVDHLHLFAAPRVWGHLREQLSGPVARMVTGQVLDLAHLRPSELAVHAAVVTASAKGPVR